MVLGGFVIWFSNIINGSSKRLGGMFSM